MYFPLSASIAASIGTDLQTVADSIALAASVGVIADLEAAASGVGFCSFADAVGAYNKQYGSNYSVDEAKAALGHGSVLLALWLSMAGGTFACSSCGGWFTRLPNLPYNL